jgi:hypothetical protein
VDRLRTIILALAGVLPGFFGPASWAEEFESGGPLSGVRLPPAKTQHGEPAGFPGCIPELAAAAKPGDDGYRPFTSQDMAAERELYPGSVEHYRSYWSKYVPVRSFFDRQSQLQNWVSPDIPGAGAAACEEYAAPVYWVPRGGLPLDTGRKLTPVSVVRCTATGPALRLDLGELHEGLYAVRVIGAVETAKLRPFRLPLYVALTVNDGVQGQRNTYRIRCGYVDEFYSVAEIYFQAPEKRSYAAELAVDHNSAVDLLVHNVTFDDVLAGTVRKAIKQRPCPVARWINRKLAKQGLTPGLGYLQRTPFSLLELDEDQPRGQAPLSAGVATTTGLPIAAGRLDRDERLWKALPPLNAQPGARQIFSMGFLNPGFDEGDANKTLAQIIAEQGTWAGAARDAGDGALADERLMQGAFLENKKLGLVYTIDDLWQHKRLPAPYPYPDDGAGLFFADPHSSSAGRVIAPIAEEVGARIHDYPRWIAKRTAQWKQSGNLQAARDAMVALVRFAYQFPALDSANGLVAVATMPAAGCADLRCRNREGYAWWGVNYPETLVECYEQLFPLLRNDTELARSVGRFVPWVKSPQDVIQLLDVYLVQSAAKRWLRYHEFFSDPFYGPPQVCLQRWAAILGDDALTRPWNDWLKASLWEPTSSEQRSAAIMELTELAKEPFAKRKNLLSVFNTCDADEMLDPCLRRFLVAGRAPVEPKLIDLVVPGNPLTIGTPMHHLWPVGIRLGSIPFQDDGSYAGRPETPMQHCLYRNPSLGWSKEMFSDGMPGFLVKDYGKRNLPDAEWEQVQAQLAAPGQRQRSRSNYASTGWTCSDRHVRVHEFCYATLESGRPGDYRLRRAVYVGVGQTYRIASASSYAMLLTVCAHGLPMTQLVRAAYNTDRTNLNGVMGVNDCGNGIGSETKGSSYSWVHSMSSAPGVSFVSAETPSLSTGQLGPAGGPQMLRAKPGMRQVALVDVGDDCYVFDVYRNSGGQWHTYRLTGPVGDAFSSNVQNEKPLPRGDFTDASLFDPSFSENYRGYHPQCELFAGIAPETYLATWPYCRTGPRGEQEYLGNDFDPQSPQKFLRLHLLGAGGLHVLRAANPIYKVQNYTDIMIQKRGPKETTDLESAFTAILEPYAGAPFLREQKSLPVEGSETDYRRAVAVEVRTTNGHTDICFADGRPEKTRLVKGSAFSLQASGEFAFYSHDRHGFRHAALVAGTSVEGPEVRIHAATAAYTGTIQAVDYANNSVRLNETWPRVCAWNVLEIGTRPRCSTTYTVRNLDNPPGGTRLVLHKSADFFRAPIKTLIPRGVKVGGKIYDNATLDVRFTPETNFSPEDSPIFGRDYQASNATRTKFWTARSNDGHRLELTGASVSEADFAPSGEVVLWEYKPGDPVRQNTYCAVRRLGGGVYEASGNVEMKISLPAPRIEVSPDQVHWKPATLSAVGPWSTVTVSVVELEHGPRYLRTLDP